jgi:hypothetical protein
MTGGNQCCFNGNWYVPTLNSDGSLTGQYIGVSLGYINFIDNASNPNLQGCPQSGTNFSIMQTVFLNPLFKYYYGSNFSWDASSITSTTPSVPLAVPMPNFYNNTYTVNSDSTNIRCGWPQNYSCKNDCKCGNTSTCGNQYSPPSISAAQLSSNYNLVTLSNANYPCKRYFGNNVSSQLYPGNYLLMK